MLLNFLAWEKKTVQSSSETMVQGIRQRSYSQENLAPEQMGDFEGAGVGGEHSEVCGLFADDAQNPIKKQALS